ncbi:DgyrCDS6096 [Dimorphilus gyrociliatus]|uniref:DgyrCDS6096 n=1 Tax=Dimorphilus gyrociliatus TaxID=2664684 RepID=A0A7I8VPB8_9ANNE|nr:DgyrCDS6096 [Dimorphilus gyrociliatus]
MKIMNGITRACNEELQSYLKVEYDCVEDVFAALQCRDMRSTMTLSSEKGNLVASSSYDCRYKIKAAQVHHRIRLTLLDFTAFRTNGSWSNTKYRHNSKVLFTVSDQSTNQRYTSTMQRRSVVYVSERPEIDVSIMKLEREFGSFILQYEAIGCKRLQEDPKYLYKYGELKVSISCKDKDILTIFECKGVDWIGEYPNCVSEVKEKVFDIPYGVLVSIIIAASLILGVVILVCGLVFLQWRRNKEIYKETTLRKPIGARKLAQQQKEGISQNEPLYNEYSRIDYQQVAPREVCPHRPIYYELDTSSKSGRENGCDTRVTV